MSAADPRRGRGAALSRGRAARWLAARGVARAADRRCRLLRAAQRQARRRPPHDALHHRRRQCAAASERVKRVMDPNCHAEYPHSRTRRMIGNVRITAHRGRHDRASRPISSSTASAATGTCASSSAQYRYKLRRENGRPQDRRAARHPRRRGTRQLGRGELHPVSARDRRARRPRHRRARHGGRHDGARRRPPSRHPHRAPRADPAPAPRDAFARDFNARIYDEFEALRRGRGGRGRLYRDAAPVPRGTQRPRRRARQARDRREAARADARRLRRGDRRRRAQRASDARSSATPTPSIPTSAPCAGSSPTARWAGSA